MAHTRMEVVLSHGRQRITSGSPYEAQVGYSRAIRVGNVVYVSGTTSFKDGVVVGGTDPAAQTREILSTIERALTEAGSALDDVVRVRIYLTHVEDFHAVGEALREKFGEIRPANTLVIVAGLVHPEMLVEIEVDAVIDG